MKKVRGVFVLWFTVIMFFCTSIASVTWGSGKVITQERDVPQFHSIELAGSGNVYIQPGEVQSLEVTTDDNLINRLETEVWNGKLKIGFKPGSNSPTRLDVHITVKELDTVIISGAGNILGKGLFKTNDFQTKISGSGNIEFELNAERIQNKISGSGNIRIRGNTLEEKVEINGSGNYDGFDLQAKKAYVVIRGSGNSQLYVTDELNVELYGSGDVEYKGRPIINSSSHGSGRVKSKN